MDRQSNFLPQRLKGALKSLVLRAAGGVIMLAGVWAVVALIFHNPYLDGVGCVSTFGPQGVMGNVVGAVRFAIGFVPGLFLFLLLARMGLAMLVRWENNDSSPEYNVVRAFITLVLGAGGFGLVAPGATFGGLVGVIVASDLRALGAWMMPVGLLALCGFFVMGGVLLHIKWAHIRAAARMVGRAGAAVCGVLHLGMRRRAAAAETDSSEEDATEEDAADGGDTETDASDADAAPAPKRGILRKRAAPTRPIAAPAPRSTVRTAPARGVFQLPSPKLLERSNFGKNVVTPELKRTAAAMEVHFAEYGVRGKVVGIRPGPIVTLYEFLPDSGTRMNDVSGTVKDMTRAMATENIRIAHIPGTQLIGVEMVNVNRQTVRYQALMENPTFVNSKYRVPLALGVDIGGNPMYYDLAKMPHMLIAGRTGSGKSVFVQSIITSVVYHFTPDKCKLMIIDPKGVDFTMWDDIPHLITPIIKMDAVAAVTALKWSVGEMENRYKRLQLMGAQNIESYNEIVAKKRGAGEKVTRQVAVGTDPETGELEFETQEVDLSDMPYLVIIIDEVADLMSVARKDVEMGVQRLAQKARAAGIHLVMATQRPDAQTITGVIKANFPTRISFQARSAIDSRTTLGEGGAENLLSCGDMLFSEAGRVPVRIHGAFIQDSELIKVADFLRTQGAPEYVDGVCDGDAAADGAPAPAAGAGKADKGDKDGDLYERAKEIVVRDKRPTGSYLQRRLGIGYNKAASLIERMEQDGVISAPDASGKRQIL